MATRRPYNAGDELKSTYSLTADNAYLLTYYGFAVPDNMFDTVYLSLKSFTAGSIIARGALHRFTSAFLIAKAPPMLALHAARANVTRFSELNREYAWARAVTHTLSSPSHRHLISISSPPL